LIKAESFDRRQHVRFWLIKFIYSFAASKVKDFVIYA